jgi:HAD superfamily hydrolase (TIGR01509 family)
VRAVAFDLDGLIFNTEVLYVQVMEELLRRRDRPFSWDLIDQMMGRPGRVALQIMIDWHELDDAVESLFVESDEVLYEICQRELSLMPGLSELLYALEASGIPKAIATSSRAAVVHKMLDKFDLRPRFQFVLTAEDVTHGKPDPEIYLTAAKRLGVEPGQMMGLEDSQNGCRAAVRAGAVAVAVPGEHNAPRHDFSGCALLVGSLADERIYRLLDGP